MQSQVVTATREATTKTPLGTQIVKLPRVDRD